MVYSHYSHSSCIGSDRLFQHMFPDSAIAKAFSCGETKCAYVMYYGLAPYFTQELKSQIRLLDSFVILFNESHSPVTNN